MKIAKRKMGWLTGTLLLWLAAAPLAQAFYNPTTGRWLSRDPLGERATQHLYGFVENSPITQFDVDGRLSASSCQTAVDNALKSNKRARDIVKEMKDRKCPDPWPHCRDCCGEEEKQNYGGYFDILTGTKYVVLCSNKHKTGQQVIESLVHELVHALDDCKKLDWKDCGQRACSEIKAVDCSGQCATGGSHRLAGETYRECVERTATASTMSDPKCTARDVASKLNECMGSCP